MIDCWASSFALKWRVEKVHFIVESYSLENIMAHNVTPFEMESILILIVWSFHFGLLLKFTCR